MYSLTIKGKKFTIPKQNLRFLAMERAISLGQKVPLETHNDVVKFLSRLGIEVEELNNE